MKKVLIFLILFNFTFTNIYADNKYFLEGVKLFEKKEFDNAKFKFEQDIVFNPKSELSYLYLAKIFKSKDKDNLTEQNLDTVILINPQNEEALYEMIILKIKKSDFTKTEKLLNNFSKICTSLCSKKKELNNLLIDSQKK
mgnify:FL=1|tara:strand:- start:345 stop:764 length:420 start_codon:yes stop_codon:yes gene_type:complete